MTAARLVAATAAVLALTACGTDKPATPVSAGRIGISGVVVLELPNFEWQSADNPVCKGREEGHKDVVEGAPVVFFDASGKTLTVGKLGTGQARGIATGADGTVRASTCTLPFSAEVPAGVGPYGVEVSNRACSGTTRVA